ncbi:MAG: SRPBCC family protein [Longimicrobiales bacterium]
MTTMTQTATTHVFRVYIRATPQAIWDAITTPEWTQKYGYRGAVEYDLRPGGAYKGLATPEMLQMGAPAVMLDGEVLEADPPRKLVQTWRALWEPLIGEGFTRVTWEIDEDDFGLTRLTVTHELEGAPTTAAQVAGQLRLAEGGGGWAWILSDLKTLLESGTSLGG